MPNEQKTKLFRLVVLVLICLLPACSSAGQSTPAPEAVAVNEWIVEPTMVEEDDLAQILAVNRWKFNVKQQGGGERGLLLALDFVSPEGESQRLNEIRMISEEAELESLIAVYPLDESLHRAEQIRIYMKAGSGSNSIVLDNPFRDFSASYMANSVEPVGGDTFRLMAFDDDGPMPSDSNHQLLLRVEAFEPENW